MGLFICYFFFLLEQVREFSGAVYTEEDAVAHGGSIKAPKVLADIVESIAAAIYVDVNFDLQKLWVVCTNASSFCSFVRSYQIININILIGFAFAFGFILG